MAERHFVYVIRTADTPGAFYVGLSADVDRRIADHNAGRCQHTAKRRPWIRHVVVEFPTQVLAARFEHYLKSGSGRVFAKRHFEP
jgi:putative endonuclease